MEGGEGGGGGRREGLEQRGEARKLARNRGWNRCIGGRNEVERLRPDASLTMSNRTFTCKLARRSLVRITSIRAMRLKSPR